MFTSLWSYLSFGKRFIAASSFYLGVGLILLGVTPDIPRAEASSGCGECPEGQICVQIGEDYECQCPEE